MKRDFALRIDTLLSGVRASLESVIYYTKNHISRGDLTEEEWKRLTSLIAKSMGETFKLSNELYAEFPDIMPDELKSGRKPKP